jgi:hypothetical protein
MKQPEVVNELNERLKGLQIDRVEYDDDAFPVIRLSDGSGIWIQKDDECNGPGVPVLVYQENNEQKELGMYQIR